MDMNPVYLLQYAQQYIVKKALVILFGNVYAGVEIIVMSHHIILKASTLNHVGAQGGKNMNVYLEGPDAVGKTTLAQWLRSKHEFSVCHLTADTPNTYAFHEKLINKTDWVVYDRFCIGERVYSELYGRVPKISEKECDMIIKDTAKNHGIFVLMLASNLDDIAHRLIARKEFQYLGEILKQSELYSVFKKYESPSFIVHDISKGYDELYKKIGGLIDAV